MALVEQFVDKLFGSWFSPALCLAILTFVLLLIVWIGGAGDWVYKSIQWAGTAAVVTALLGGWFANKKKTPTDILSEMTANVV